MYPCYTCLHHEAWLRRSKDIWICHNPGFPQPVKSPLGKGDAPASPFLGPGNNFIQQSFDGGGRGRGRDLGSITAFLFSYVCAPWGRRKSRVRGAAPRFRRHIAMPGGYQQQRRNALKARIKWISTCCDRIQVSSSIDAISAAYRNCTCKNNIL